MPKALTSGHPAKLIILFSIPLVLGNLFQQLYNTADTLIVGRTLGVSALAAVGSTGSLSFLVIGFVVGLTNGVTYLTAQKFGMNDIKGVKRSFAGNIIIAVVSSLILTLFASIFAYKLLELLNTPDTIIKEAHSYIFIIYLGIPAIMMYNLFFNTIRCLGDSRVPLGFLIFASILNIILDIIFIMVFKMGVAGAGLATVIAQFIAAILCVVYIRYKLPILHLSREDFKVSLKEMLINARAGILLGFQISIIGVGALILQGALNTLGETAVAAHTAAVKIDGFATLPLSSIGVTVGTYVAQNYGAGDLARIKKGVTQSVFISVGFSIIMGFINIFFGSELTTLFVSREATEVIKLSHLSLLVNGISYFSLSLLFVYRNALQGLGKTFMPFFSGIMELVMRAFAGILLIAPFGYLGATFSNPLAWVGGAVPLGIAYYRTIKRLENHIELMPQKIEG